MRPLAAAKFYFLLLLLYRVDFRMRNSGILGHVDFYVFGFCSHLFSVFGCRYMGGSEYEAHMGRCMDAYRM